MLNYILNLATAGLAAFALAKDWNAHQNRWRRWTVAALITILGCAALVNTHLSNTKAIEQQQRADARHSEDENQIAGLKTAVEAANRAQESNTKQFIASFTNLTGQLNNLQTRVETAGLQKEAGQLRAELTSTRQALSPPQVDLVTSLEDLGLNIDKTPAKEAVAQPNTDGSFSFIIVIGNRSQIQARNGRLHIRLCDQCAWAEEPKGFVKPGGSAETDREMPFDLLPATQELLVSLKLVRPPVGIHKMVMGVLVRCENCKAEPMEPLTLDYP
jgi:hypothetical protein